MSKNSQCSLRKIYQVRSHRKIYSGFFPITFVYSRSSPNIKFLYCLLSSVALWGGLMVDTEGKTFEINVCRSMGNVFSLKF